MYKSQSEEKESNENEDLLINRIIENFDDINNPLPCYDDLQPEFDPELVSQLPMIKLNVSSKLNTDETAMLFELAKDIDKSNTKRMKKSHSVAFLKLNDLQGQIYGNDDPKKLLEYRNYFEEARREIKIVNEYYYKLNGYINYFYNESLFIWNNPILNLKNKKIKLAELLGTMKQDFNLEFLKFEEMKINFQYLNCLKGEFLKFLKYRFEIMYNYIRDARFLEEFMKDK